MAAHGVRTLYIETANYHCPATPPPCSAATTLAALIQECHARGIKVVAWYLPGFNDPAKDYKRSMAAIASAPPTARSSTRSPSTSRRASSSREHAQRAVSQTLSSRIRAAVGARYPLGGIIPSPAGMVMQPDLLAGLPLQDAGRHLRRDRADGLLHVPRRRLRQRLPRHARQHPHHPRADRPADDPHPRDRRRRRQVVRQRDDRATCAPCARTARLGGSMYDWATTSDAELAGAGTTCASTRARRRRCPGRLPFAAPLGTAPPTARTPRRSSTRPPARRATGSCSFRLYDVQADEVRLVVNWQDKGPLARGAGQGVERRARRGDHPGVAAQRRRRAT